MKTEEWIAWIRKQDSFEGIAAVMEAWRKNLKRQEVEAFSEMDKEIEP